MLKTTKENPGRPNKALMVMGILQGYVKNPVWFLIKSLLTLPSFKKGLPGDIAREFVDAAALQTWMYIRLKEKIGQKKAFEVVRAFVLPAALAVQQGNYRTVEDERTFDNFIFYHQRLNREGITRWTAMEFLEQSESKYEWRAHSCMFHDFYSKLGIPELTRLMCEVDNAIFNTYLPDELIFHRNGIGNRISDGAPACHFVVERWRKGKGVAV